ncbi:MAG: hypothetical protein KBS81_02055, partial [Spirochaetales bacterium]|nr:hypothetical protein [Candidatus Physcosoma equi]
MRAQVAYNEFRDIEGTIRLEDSFYGMQFSNFINCHGDYVFRASNASHSVDLMYNYWGEHTDELESNFDGRVTDASFIYDAEDDPSLSALNIDNFATEPWSFAGYQGEGIVSFSVSPIYENSSYREVKVGSPVYLNIQSDDDIVAYRIAQKITDLEAKSFEEYYGNCEMPASSINQTEVDKNNGKLNLYVQVKTSDGRISPYQMVSVGYDLPYVYDIKVNNSVTDNLKFTSDLTPSIEWSFHNAGYSIIYQQVYIDDTRIIDGGWWIDNNASTRYDSVFDTSRLKNGEHTLRFEIHDWVGDSAATTIPFLVERKSASISKVEFDSATEIAENDSLKFTVYAADTRHLKEIRAYSDGYLLSAVAYEDGGLAQVRVPFIIEPQYLKAGEHELIIEAEDYSGNVSASSSYSFSVGGEVGVGPTVTSISLKDGDILGNNALITVSAESAKGIRSVYIKNGSTTLGSDEGKFLNYAPSYNKRSISLDVSLLKCVDGKIDLDLLVYDFAGNVTVEKRTVTVKKTNATASIKANDKKTSFDLSVTLPDASTVSFLKVFFGEKLLGEYPLTSTTGTFTKSFTELKKNYTDGTVFPRIEIVNLAGETVSYYSPDPVTIDSSYDYVEKNLEGQFTVSGILEGDFLHWTKENSPVVVTGDVMVMDKETLVIDPGVEVFFDGPYSFLFMGQLEAVGTEEEPIVIASSKNRIDNHEGYYGRWNAIGFSDTYDVSRDGYNYTYNSGSRMAYCQIDDIGEGITGRALIENSTISSTKNAIGGGYTNSYFRGSLVNCDISGIVMLEENTIVLGNTFDGSTVNYERENNYSDNGDYWYYSVDGTGYHQYKNAFFVHSWNGSCAYVNNRIENYQHTFLETYYCDFKYNTVNNTTLKRLRSYSGINSFCNNTISNIKGTIELNNEFIGSPFSNIFNVSGTPALNVTSSRNDRPTMDFSNSYWGAAWTEELRRAESAPGRNASFIKDGYDNVQNSIVDWSGYVSAPILTSGYQGRDFVDVAVENNGSEKKIGSDIELRIRQLTNTEAEKYRISQSVSGLESAGWNDLTTEVITVPYADIDESLRTEEGFITFYVQAMKGETVSAIKSVNVPYDEPRVINLSLKEGTKFTTDSVKSFTFKTQEAGYEWIRAPYVMVGDRRLNGSFYTHKNDNQTFEIDPKWFKNGEYTLKIVSEDSVGNIGIYETTFIVERPLPAVNGFEFTSGSSVAVGSPLEFSVTLKDASHLSRIDVYSDDYLMVTRNVSGEAEKTEYFSILSQYLKNGEHNLRLVFTDDIGNVTEYAEETFTV